IERHLPSPFDTKPVYSVTASDHTWHWLYLPIARGADFLARQVGRLQQGRISVYLTYSFLTLITFLCFAGGAPQGRPKARIPPPPGAAQRPNWSMRPQAWGPNERRRPFFGAAAACDRAAARALARRLGQPVPRVALRQATNSAADV